MVVEADVCIESQSQTVAIEGREGELVLQLSFVEIDTRGITIGIKATVVRRDRYARHNYRYQKSPATDWLASWPADSLSAD